MVEMVEIERNPTRPVRIGTVTIGAGHPIAVQSMTATATQDVAATVAQVRDLEQAGADVVRIAVDNRKDAEALAEIRRQTSANLAVDLQENYRLVTDVAPHVEQGALQPGAFVSPRTRKAVAGEGEVHRRGGGTARLRHSHRRELRQRRSGQEGKVRSGRFDHPHARKRLGALRAAR